MVERMFKKGLVVGIIILFIGVSFAPSITANIGRLPTKNKLVETSIRIHRANSIIPYTVKLTEKESETIDSIFDNLKVSLDSAETGEEIDEIYDGAVESLYELGMFPRMTVEEAKQLVKGDRQNLNVKSQPDNIGNADENFNCRVIGGTTETYMHDLDKPLLNNLLEFIRSALITLMHMWEINYLLYNGRIGSISLGYVYFQSSFVYHYPAKGWVWTNGENGVKQWEGELWGNLDTKLMWYNGDWHAGDEIYIGIRNFEGLWINRLIGKVNLLGNAEHVSITYNEP